MWLDFRFISGNRAMLLRRDLLAVQLTESVLLLRFTAYDVRIEGHRLDALFQQIVDGTCTVFAEPLSRDELFAEAPTVFRIDITPR